MRGFRITYCDSKSQCDRFADYVHYDKLAELVDIVNSDWLCLTKAFGSEQRVEYHSFHNGCGAVSWKIGETNNLELKAKDKDGLKLVLSLYELPFDKEKMVDERDLPNE